MLNSEALKNEIVLIYRDKIHTFRFLYSNLMYLGQWNMSGYQIIFKMFDDILNEKLQYIVYKKNSNKWYMLLSFFFWISSNTLGSVWLLFLVKCIFYLCFPIPNTRITIEKEICIRGNQPQQRLINTRITKRSSICCCCSPFYNIIILNE